jgi:hypothetical protein
LESQSYYKYSSSSTYKTHVILCVPRKHKRQRKKSVEKKKRVVLRTIPSKKPLELAPNNTGNINQNEEEEEEEEEEEKSRKTKQRKNPQRSSKRF